MLVPLKEKPIRIVFKIDEAGNTFHDRIDRLALNTPQLSSVDLFRIAAIVVQDQFILAGRAHQQRKVLSMH